jgi:hypothetical protein
MVHILKGFCDQIGLFLVSHKNSALRFKREKSTARFLDEFRNPLQFVLMTPTRPQKAVPVPIVKNKDPQFYVLSQTVYELFQITILIMSPSSSTRIAEVNQIQHIMGEPNID